MAAVWSVFSPLMNAGCVGASDRVTVGLIGCNNQGFNNLLAFLKQSKVVCAAMFNVDQNVLNKSAAEVGQFFRQIICFPD